MWSADPGFCQACHGYKRADLLFQDIERLKRIATQVGAFQVIYAARRIPATTPARNSSTAFIRPRTPSKTTSRSPTSNYDMALGSLLTAGVDVWLNTPQPPLEASGTSGMKAALNGVPSCSVLDGWWIEGHVEGVTGWAIGAHSRGTAARDERALDAAALYDKLAQVIVPLFYSNRAGFINVMRHAIAINGQFFNTQRMMHQYVMKAYFL